MTRDQKIEKIKKFWDERAEEYGEDWQATLGERYLRLLEIREVLRLIARLRPNNVLDVGCGNGYSTAKYAERFRHISFVGLDYSEEMIVHAKKRALANCSFMVADVLKVETLPAGKYDLVLTQRCLQNLPDYEAQYQAITNLLSTKSEAGVLCLMECSKDGVYKLNKWRRKLGKVPMENLEPWHNCFFYDQKLQDDFDTKIIHFSSTYMFLVKVLSPFLATLGYLLPPLGKFGYDKVYLIKK